MTIIKNTLIHSGHTVGSLVHRALYGSGTGVVPYVFPTPFMSLSPTTGMISGMNLTRATTATLVDWEGITRTAKPNELRMEKARRVENLIINSEDFSHNSGLYDGIGLTGKIADVTSASGYRYKNVTVPKSVGLSFTFSIRMRTTNTKSAIGVRAYTSNGINSAFITANLTTTFQTYSLTLSTTSSTYTTLNLGIDNRTALGGDGLLGGVEIDWMQLENVTVQADKTASEYVSNGVLTNPWHGAGVDGVKYFQTKKDGSPLDEKPYFLIERQSANQLKDSTLGANGSGTWTTTSKIDLSYTGNIVLGYPEILAQNQATSSNKWNYSSLGSSGDRIRSILAKAGTAPIICLSSNSPTSDGAFFNLVTGTVGTVKAGTAYMEDMGDGWYWCNYVSSSSAYYQYSMHTADNQGANYASTGTETIKLLVGQAEQNVTQRSSFIPTQGSAVTRAADVLKYEFGAGSFPQEFAYVTKFAPFVGNSISSTSTDYSLFGTDGTNELRTLGATTYSSTPNITNLNYNELSVNTLTKYAVQIKASEQLLYKDGDLKLEGAANVSPHSDAGTLEIANYAGAVMPMKIYGVAVYPVLTTDELIEVTTL